MEEEDYFGDVTVPLNEEEEDAANDLTFGDIDDIKAGDDSDASWNPNHQNLSSKIEAEKEALQRQRQASPILNGFPSGLAMKLGSPNHQNHAVLQQSPLSQQADERGTAWELLKQSMLQSARQPAETSLHSHSFLQSPPQPQQQHMLPAQPLHMQQPPHQPLHPPLQQPLHQPGHLQRQPGHIPPQLQAHHPGHQVTPREYHHLLVSYQQQQTNLLLQQHQERRDKQLMEAERAQKAGIPFARDQFDRHQAATRQMIVSDHYARLRRIQYQVLQLQYQQTQQLLRPDLKTPSDHIAPLDLQQESNGVASNSQMQPSLNHALPSHHDSEPPMNGDNPTRYSGTPDIDPCQMRAKQILDSHPVTERDDEIGSAPRMLEIERQMAAAGLGPSSDSGSSRRRSAFSSAPREIPSLSSYAEKKPNRRLESMTDKDQEIVFRAHLRQIEATVSYRDDYYNSILKKKEKLGGRDIFTDLSERVHAMRLRGKERYGTKLLRIRGSKRSAASAGQDGRGPGSSPPHSDQNMRALANSLGKVQSWNPRAPRRVMDFSLLEKKDPADENDPQMLLRDDERVHVRQEVERGYDIIATIHDIARGENQQETLAKATDALVSTLHLAEKREEDAGQQDGHHESTHFFATMCIIPKGRRYIALLLDLLDVGDKVRLMSALFENLGMLVFASKKARESSSASGSSNEKLFNVMMKIVQDPDILSQDCLHMFASFRSSHAPHRDAFLTTFRSAVGSRLIFLCMQRISAGLTKQQVDERHLSLSHIDQFSETFTDALEEIFVGAESVNRVWEVVASLDALATGECRTNYRATLNRMLRSGAVPQPPAQ